MGLCKLLNKPSVAENLINVQNLHPHNHFAAMMSPEPGGSYNDMRSQRIFWELPQLPRTILRSNPFNHQ